MKFSLKNPLDMHLHLRQAAMLDLVAPLSAETFSGAVIMPNLVPPVDSLAKVLEYKEAIAKAQGDFQFTPFMTAFFRAYSKEELIELKEHVIGIKLYPQGATTNSEGGVDDIDGAGDTLKCMEELGIPLLVHGEQAGEFVMDREALFVPIYEKLAKRYPKLMIVMEHITTVEALDMLDRYENLHATVTLQHLIITLDDVAGGLLAPHLFCKPIAKRPHDRDALLQAALDAHPKLSFGSDSAPHPVDKKECCGCAAGVFSAPIALQRLVQLFDENNRLDNLQAFISDNAQRNYGVTGSDKEIFFEKKDFVVPDTYGDVVPFDAGKTLSWSVVEE